MPKTQLLLRVLRDAFFWLGGVLIVVCFLLVIGSNTLLVSRIDHGPIPLFWVMAGAAVLALTVAEYCGTGLVSDVKPPRHKVEPVSEPDRREVFL